MRDLARSCLHPALQQVLAGRCPQVIVPEGCAQNKLEIASTTQEPGLRKRNNTEGLLAFGKGGMALKVQHPVRAKDEEPRLPKI